MPLTLRQKRFSDEYIKSGNAYQSAIKAGYSEKTAKNATRQLLENTGIKKYINEQTKKLQSENIADEKEALNTLTLIMRGQIKSKKIVVDNKGDEHEIETEPTIAERMSASKEILKRYPLNSQLETQKLKTTIDLLKARIKLLSPDEQEQVTKLDQLLTLLSNEAK